MSSMVMSVDHPGLTFNLTLVRSEPTYNQPVQQWTFTSDFAVSMKFVCALWPCVLKQLDGYRYRYRYRMRLEYLSSLLRTGERLLWDLHSEADPLHNSPEYGIHSSTCLQSQRTRHLRSRHQIPASKAVSVWSVRSKSDIQYFFVSWRFSFFLFRCHWLSLFLCYVVLCYASLFRWVTRLQWNSVWTLRCSCYPRGACGSLMAPWALVRRLT